MHPSGLALTTDRLKPDEPIIKSPKAEFELPDFIPPFAAVRWGFGGVVERMADDERGWIRFHCPMPVIKEAGREEDYATSLAVRATLSVLFMCLLSEPEEETGYMIPQMIVVDGLLVKYGMNGAALSAILTPAMNPFLANANADALNSVGEAMRVTAEHMWRNKKRDKLLRCGYQAVCFEPTRLHLLVPGNSCGLDPASSFGEYEGLKSGYRLTPHNVDSGLQQLPLLMGLARLAELGRSKYI